MASTVASRIVEVGSGTGATTGLMVKPPDAPASGPVKPLKLPWISKGLLGGASTKKLKTGDPPLVPADHDCSPEQSLDRASKEASASRAPRYMRAGEDLSQGRWQNWLDQK
jgi:hypothetical protein